MPRNSQFVIDGRITRRGLLQATAGAVPLLALPGAHARQGNKRRSLILLWQDGGPSHFETFDPKPDAPAEFRGELGAIPTNLPGVAFCEVLPRLAALADRFSVIRSLHQPSSDHVVGSHNVLTGWYGETDGGKSRYPDLASVINRMRSGVDEAQIKLGASTDPRLALGMKGPKRYQKQRGLPTYVDLSRGLHRGGPAFLGPLHAPFQVAGDPSKPGFVIQNLQSVGSAIRLQERFRVLGGLDRLKHGGAERASEGMRAIEGFHTQARELIAGGTASRAFDVSRESARTLERYGRHLAGQQCLLARRLVEAGVEVVAVRFSPDGRGDYDRTMIGWDDHAVHGNIFSIMRMRGPQFDQALSALIEDLEARQMQDEVLVVLVGEFGRTPRIHVHRGCPGREHWGPAGCALVYGGGLRMGQVVGSTDSQGQRPHDDPVTYKDLLATIYHAMGVDFSRTLLNHVGRPVPILSDGQPISALLEHKSRQSRPAGSIELRSHAARTGTLEIQPGQKLTQLLRDSAKSQVHHVRWHDGRLTEADLAVLKRLPGLVRLEFNGTPVSDADMPHLADLSRLEELNLTNTRVTDKGLLRLDPLTSLKRLFFSGTSISLTAVVRLFVESQDRTLGEALSAIGLLRGEANGSPIIDVAGTTFGDHEMQYLLQLRGVRELQLTATSVTDQGLKHLKHLPDLEGLYLAKCGIGDEGLAQVTNLPRLRQLNLYGTKVTTAGLKHLHALRELRHLLITDVKLETAAVDALKQKLPQLIVTDYTPA